VTAPATRTQERRCLVCGAPLVWPALYFDRPACSEAWVREARDRDGADAAPAPAGSRGPGTKARGRRRGRP